MGTLTTRPTLLARLRDTGDQDAWRAFADLYAPLVQRFARSRGLEVEAADALTQRFLVRALETLPRFDYRPDRGRFRSWVVTVARNELRQEARAESARARALERYEEQLERQSVEAADLAWAEAEERRRFVELALARLRREADPTHVAVFEAVVLRGDETRDVARFHGLGQAQVAVIKCRLLARLRRIAGELNGAWS